MVAMADSKLQMACYCCKALFYVLYLESAGSAEQKFIYVYFSMLYVEANF